MDDVLAPAGEGVGADEIGPETSRGPAVPHAQRNIALIWKRLSIRPLDLMITIEHEYKVIVKSTF